jgi:hypothetical protein
MDFSQNKDALMLLEMCVVDISLHILQEFHAKQGDIYGINYYP